MSLLPKAASRLDAGRAFVAPRAARTKRASVPDNVCVPGERGGCEARVADLSRRGILEHDGIKGWQATPPKKMVQSGFRTELFLRIELVVYIALGILLSVTALLVLGSTAILLWEGNP